MKGSTSSMRSTAGRLVNSSRRADNGTDRYGCCVSLLGVGVLSNLWSFLFKEPSSVLKGGDDNDNLSTKCSGLLLRSSFAILAARTRHLISVARMAAFSVASRLSNSSDILLRAASEPPRRGSPVARTRFKTLIYLKGFGVGACGALVSTSKVLAQMNKSPDGD